MAAKMGRPRRGKNGHILAEVLGTVRRTEAITWLKARVKAVAKSVTTI